MTVQAEGKRTRIFGGKTFFYTGGVVQEPRVRAIVLQLAEKGIKTRVTILKGLSLLWTDRPVRLELGLNPRKIFTPEVKEPWQMTKTEFYTRPSVEGITTQAAELRGLFRPHKEEVSLALSEGKPVPPEVLKDYPDLAKAIPEVPPAPEVTSPEDLVVSKGKYYHPLGMWAIKKPSIHAAADFARKNNMYAFQWRGIGSFVSAREPPVRKGIIPIIVKPEITIPKAEALPAPEVIETEEARFARLLAERAKAIPSDAAMLEYYKKWLAIGQTKYKRARGARREAIAREIRGYEKSIADLEAKLANPKAKLPAKVTPAPEVKEEAEVRREQMRKDLMTQEDSINQEIKKEIGSYRPLGKMSEVGEVLGVRPTRGQLVSTPFGSYVFAKARLPDAETVKRWHEKRKEAEELGRRAAAEISFIVVDPGLTTGNIRELEQGRKLKAQGLLSPRELKYVDALEEFWAKYPNAGYGVVQADGSIKPPTRFVKNPEVAIPKAEAAPAPGATKPYWEKTQRELVAGYRRVFRRAPDLAARTGMFRAHYMMIKDRLEKGLEVPAKVLKDYPLKYYPDLAKTTLRAKSKERNPMAELDWAIGAMGTHLLGSKTQATWAPRLNRKNFNIAVKILRKHAGTNRRAAELLGEVTRNPILPEIGSGIVAGLGIGTGWSLMEYAKGKLGKKGRK